MFSPYYSVSRRLGLASPENHVALNVALYGRRGHRWAMTERGNAGLRRSPCHLTLGPSDLTWDNDVLRIRIREWAVPVPRRLEGEVELSFEAAPAAPHALDTLGRHHWYPIAPRARAFVRFKRPDISWSGPAYIDSNLGEEPLADTFRDWSWSRTIEKARTRVYYDIVRRDGSAHEMALSFSGDRALSIAPPPKTTIGLTRWRLPLAIRSEHDGDSRKIAAWEDGPFYARTLIQHQLDGAPTLSVHERLSLTRFEQAWVLALLPFRMPRRTF